VSCQLHSPAALLPERALGTHWIEGRMHPRAGLDVLVKRIFLTIVGLELRSLGRTARLQDEAKITGSFSSVRASDAFSVETTYHRMVDE
jgi:hypothetical protein